MKRSRWGSAPFSSSVHPRVQRRAGSAEFGAPPPSAGTASAPACGGRSGPAAPSRIRTHRPSAAAHGAVHREERAEPAAANAPAGVLSRVKEAVLHVLSHHERLLLVLWYVERMTLAEIARTLNLTEQQAHRMHADILIKLRAA